MPGGEEFTEEPLSRDDTLQAERKGHHIPGGTQRTLHSYPPPLPRQTSLHDSRASDWVCGSFRVHREAVPRELTGVDFMCSGEVKGRGEARRERGAGGAGGKLNPELNCAVKVGARASLTTPLRTASAAGGGREPCFGAVWSRGWEVGDSFPGSVTRKGGVDRAEARGKVGWGVRVGTVPSCSLV